MCVYSRTIQSKGKRQRQRQCFLSLFFFFFTLFFLFTSHSSSSLLHYSFLVSHFIQFSFHLIPLPPPPSLGARISQANDKAQFQKMSTTTLAELSISLNHVQSLLTQITAEVKVLSDGIGRLVEEEENEELEAELSYLDVDPWSNVKDKDKDKSTAKLTKAVVDEDGGGGGGGGSKSRRQNSIRSLLQRKPSTVKDETKALARILSQKRTNAGSGSESERLQTGDGGLSKQQLQLQQQLQYQQQQLAAASKWSSVNLQEQIIDEDLSSERDSPPPPLGEKQELEFLTESTYNSINSISSTSSTPTPQHESERVPHKITVQTNNIQKYSLAISKPTSATQSPTHVLASSASQGSILSAMNNYSQQSGNSSGAPPFWRSSTVPNTSSLVEGGGSSRPGSANSNFSADGQVHRSGGGGSAANVSALCVEGPQNNKANQTFLL